MKNKFKLLSIFMSLMRLRMFFFILTGYFTTIHIFLHITTKMAWKGYRIKHLIEIVVSLMLNTNVHKHHCGDAIFATLFLINKMSSSSLEN